MQKIEQYVSASVGDDAVLKRRVIGDLKRAGVVVTADTTESYRQMIDSLLAKIKAKRTPVSERQPVPYEAELGEHDRKVIAGIDPLTGERLTRVKLAGKRYAMFNPKNNSVWPIPVNTGAAPAI
jgi:hypothetical protein